MTPEVAALLREAVASHVAGRLDEAEARYRAVLSNDPVCAQAAHPLGVLLLEDGRIDEAEALLACAVRAAPRWAEAHNNLGVALRGLGRTAEAASAFGAAVALRPEMFDARNNLAEALLETEQWGAAMDAALAAHRIEPRHPGPLLAMGIVHFRCAEYPAAIERLRDALVRDASNERAEALLRAAESRLVEPWHFAMVNEVERNDAYDAALRRVVPPGALVLEIGTGAGLLAMMAARAGAGRVVPRVLLVSQSRAGGGGRDAAAVRGAQPQVAIFRARSAVGHVTRLKHSPTVGTPVVPLSVGEQAVVAPPRAAAPAPAVDSARPAAA